MSFAEYFFVSHNTLCCHSCVKFYCIQQSVWGPVLFCRLVQFFKFGPFRSGVEAGMKKSKIMKTFKCFCCTCQKSSECIKDIQNMFRHGPRILRFDELIHLYRSPHDYYGRSDRCLQHISVLQNQVRQDLLRI